MIIAFNVFQAVLWIIVVGVSVRQLRFLYSGVAVDRIALMKTVRPMLEGHRVSELALILGRFPRAWHATLIQIRLFGPAFSEETAETFLHEVQSNATRGLTFLRGSATISTSAGLLGAIFVAQGIFGHVSKLTDRLASGCFTMALGVSTALVAITGWLLCRARVVHLLNELTEVDKYMCNFLRSQVDLGHEEMLGWLR